MSTGEDPGRPGSQGMPSEEELRAAYEAELARLTTTDMIAQSAVSLLNLGARRIGPPPGAETPPGESPGGERDLEQVRDAIDGSMALLAILERRIPAEQLRPLRDALSRLQMAYAAEVRGEGGEEGSGGPEDGGPGGPGDGGPGEGGAAGRRRGRSGSGPGVRRAQAGTRGVERPAVGAGQLKAAIRFRQPGLRGPRERASGRAAR